MIKSNYFRFIVMVSFLLGGKFMNLKYLDFKNIKLQKLLLITYLIVIVPTLIIQIAMNTKLVNTYEQELSNFIFHDD